MPRKVQSSGESTQGRKTSEKRAMGAAGGHSRSGVPDGGKWAGSGRNSPDGIPRRGPLLEAGK